MRCTENVDFKNKQAGKCFEGTTIQQVIDKFDSKRLF